MPKLSPTRKLGVYGKFDINPADAVGNFIESKQKNKSYQTVSFAGRRHTSLELLSVHNERERKQMMNDQLQMINDTNEYKVTRAKRIEDIIATQSKLRDEFAKVNSFITICEEKGRTAERQVAAEIRTQKELKKSIEKYTSEIKDLEEFNEELQKSVELLEPYEVVMKQVVADNDLYKNIEDCMKRCDAITLAQDEIKELERRKIQEVEEMRLKIVKEMKDEESVLVGMKNAWDAFEREYEEAKAKNLKAEKTANDVKAFYTTQEVESRSMIDAISHMHTILCKRRGLDPNLDKVSVDEMLDFIKSEIVILEQVVEGCKKKREERAKVAQSRFGRKYSMRYPVKIVKPIINVLQRMKPGKQEMSPALAKYFKKS